MEPALPLDRFLAAVRAADPAGYPGVPPAVVERLRADLLRYYDGVHPVETYRDPSGATVDVIPHDEFPTVRAARAEGHAVAMSAPCPSGYAGEAAGPPPAPPPPGPAAGRPVVRVARQTLDDAVRVWLAGAALVKGPPPALPESAGPHCPPG